MALFSFLSQVSMMSGGGDLMADQKTNRDDATVVESRSSWALSVFFNFFNNKKLFFFIFYKVNNLFLHQSYLKSPLPIKLT